MGYVVMVVIVRLQIQHCGLQVLFGWGFGVDLCTPAIESSSCSHTTRQWGCSVLVELSDISLSDPTREKSCLSNKDVC